MAILLAMLYLKVHRGRRVQETVLLDIGAKIGGAQAPPSSNFQTGMPSFLALSARFAEIPEPGNTMTPIGRISSILSLRLNGAALA